MIPWTKQDDQEESSIVFPHAFHRPTHGTPSPCMLNCSSDQLRRARDGCPIINEWSRICAQTCRQNCGSVEHVPSNKWDRHGTMSQMFHVAINVLIVLLNCCPETLHRDGRDMGFEMRWVKLLNKLNIHVACVSPLRTHLRYSLPGLEL